MQLALVDIASKHNECYRALLENDQIKNNETIGHIAGGQKSFRIVTQIIRMKSECFMKPFQLQTIMSYAELLYHSNDFQFLALMKNVLGVVKSQLK